ncbi:MAG: hypothetical protein KDJ72_06415 [Methyloceanibacter sp.]|uniref:hypothetical protein n=1 Tax=Methyloceanibacter sp. TaxID=1965321 RepID=UPI001DF923AE|nr:hypothetical protein [Methyloceanibacter sp.]MCB1442639.1 hypothetical protein [Methyloceanibacter sp.]MCC0058524.1 hypothetical protein [Hyphomicrobiaceae bacterium]
MESTTRHSRWKPGRLDVWGDSLLNQLKGISRKRRKRLASKKRRAAQRQELPR